MSKALDGQGYEVIRNFRITGIMLFTNSKYNIEEKNLKPVIFVEVRVAAEAI